MSPGQQVGVGDVFRLVSTTCPGGQQRLSPGQQVGVGEVFRLVSTICPGGQQRLSPGQQVGVGEVFRSVAEIDCDAGVTRGTVEVVRASTEANKPQVSSAVVTITTRTVPSFIRGIR